MNQQLRTVNLKCASCGGSLEIHGDMDRFACGYCGSEQIVERRGGTIGLRLVVDGVARVQIGTDKTAAELAVVRLERELSALYVRWEEEGKNFRVRNKSNSATATIVVVLSVLGCMLTLAVLFNAAQTPERIIGSLPVIGASIAAVIWGLKQNDKAQKDYNVKSAEFSGPYHKEKERLEEQIAIARRIIHS